MKTNRLLATLSIFAILASAMTGCERKKERCSCAENQPLKEQS